MKFKCIGEEISSAIEVFYWPVALYINTQREDLSIHASIRSPNIMPIPSAQALEENFEDAVNASMKAVLATSVYNSVYFLEMSLHTDGPSKLWGLFVNYTILYLSTGIVIFVIVIFEDTHLWVIYTTEWISQV